MPRNPATEVLIRNKNAKAALVTWWATMQARGYQYGFEALCNVWVGFEGGRNDLARKVMATVEAEEESRFGKGAHGISAALRDLFQEEGIDLPTENPGSSVPE